MYEVEVANMATQKELIPSISSILSVLSIVFCCVGFLRVEVELNEQRRRINTLENVAESKPQPSREADLIKPKTQDLGKLISRII